MPSQPPAITPAPAAVFALQADESSAAAPECYESYSKLQYDLYSKPAIARPMPDDLATYLPLSGG